MPPDATNNDLLRDVWARIVDLTAVAAKLPELRQDIRDVNTRLERMEARLQRVERRQLREAVKRALDQKRKEKGDEARRDLSHDTRLGLWTLAVSAVGWALSIWHPWTRG